MSSAGLTAVRRQVTRVGDLTVETLDLDQTP
jgi:hypothetical protein